MFVYHDTKKLFKLLIDKMDNYRTIIHFNNTCHTILIQNKFIALEYFDALHFEKWGSSYQE